MNHAITIGGLLLSIGALVGLASTAFGLLAIFAEGMSDAPQEGMGAGCVFLPIGLVLLIGCIIGLIV